MNARTASSAFTSLAFVKCVYAPSRCHLEEYQSDERTRASTLGDARVEAVITYHCQCFHGESALIFDHVIQVLMSEAFQIFIDRLTTNSLPRHVPMISSRCQAHSEAHRCRIWWNRPHRRCQGCLRTSLGRCSCLRTHIPL